MPFRTFFLASLRRPGRVARLPARFSNAAPKESLTREVVGVLPNALPWSPPRRLGCAALATLALLVSNPLTTQGLRATTVRPPSFPELVERAESIVEGTIRTVRCEQSAHAGRPVIHTYVTVEVAKNLKGAPPQTLELRFLGGTVGDLTMEVSGMPRFVPGERALLFIERNGTQFCPLVGVMHGRYRIEQRSSDGADVVHRNNGEPLRSRADVARPLAHEASATSAAAGASDTGAMELAAFEAEILAEVARAATR